MDGTGTAAYWTTAVEAPTIVDGVFISVLAVGLEQEEEEEDDSKS